jgi:hypothetical protein
MDATIQPITTRATRLSSIASSALRSASSSVPVKAAAPPPRAHSASTTAGASGRSDFARVDPHAAPPSICRTRAARSLVEKGLVM